VLHQETHARLTALLDEAQRQKLEALHEEHKQHRGGHGGGEGRGHDREDHGDDG
jgi:hypothetical protein